MNRILFEREEIRPGGKVLLQADDPRAVHIRNVLRAEAGDPLKTGETGGLAGVSRIERIGGAGEVEISVCHDTPAPAPWIDIILAMPRPRVYKRLLPQLAALGTRRLVLAGCEKTEKAYWGAHWLDPAAARPLLVEGLVQSGATILPEISIERNFASFAKRGALSRIFEGQACRFAAHPAPGAPGIHSTLPPGAVPVLAIGPEGGWTDAELALLDGAGFARLSLGPRILRTDTAAVSLVAVLSCACAANG